MVPMKLGWWCAILNLKDLNTWMVQQRFWMVSYRTILQDLHSPSGIAKYFSGLAMSRRCGHSGMVLEIPSIPGTDSLICNTSDGLIFLSQESQGTKVPFQILRERGRGTGRSTCQLAEGGHYMSFLHFQLSSKHWERSEKSQLPNVRGGCGFQNWFSCQKWNCGIFQSALIYSIRVQSFIWTQHGCNWWHGNWTAGFRMRRSN